MSTHSGLKHAAEPAPLETKRERRRTVGTSAGRAAVLRRAPSDSDCSGETASLSADSGDRVLRAAPPPPRQAKSRSRRRGSEWEVLEGLKDGQRFDRRPEVFNGYLHKKRKWPLKGWHKRFFVVDGGILVYARSPTDVARGRLHGSVDVGLSVISAKARRRRIDIDADEFIYHLRAKTPDVFRTWLNVLKAHRLYRQHLLTFGARETAPKILPPLEDIPPTDTSSRASNSTLENSPTMSSSVEVLPTVSIQPVLPKGFSQKVTCFDTNIPSSIYDKPSPLNVWSSNCDSNALMPLNFEPIEDKQYFFRKVMPYRSLCSMNCMAKLFRDDPDNSPMSLRGTEKQMLSTELDFRSPIRTGSDVQSSLLYKYSFNSPTVTNSPKSSDSKAKGTSKRKHYVFSEKKFERTTALFFFARKDRYSRASSPTDVHMRKSKKCTNLVKYRNLVDEPALKKPLSRCMLLGKCNLKISKNTSPHTHICKISGEVQVEIENKEQSLQDITTASEYDKITERLMISVLELQKTSNKVYTETEVKVYINQIVRELYDIKWNPIDSHPIKALFRSLLEYWLKNSSIEHVKEAIKEVKTTDKQSNEHFTKNQQLSSVFVGNATKQTQISSIKVIKDHKTTKIINESKICRTKNRAESFEKERRVQELERLLKNTVYICETVRSSQSKERDIKITQKLIDNLEKLSNKYVSSNESNDNSSTEFPKIQETLNHLISDTSIPHDMAKEFLGAYLDVLLHDSDIGNTDSSSPSTDDSISKQVQPVCDVQTESVVKKVSKSITTVNKIPDKNSVEEETQPIDPGQLYLRDILDKITTIFSKVKFPNISTSWKCNTKGKSTKSDTKSVCLEKDELGRPIKEYLAENIISENCNDNSVVIDVSKYDLEHVSMVSDPDIKGIMSINLKLKERTPNFGECRPTNLSLNFSGDNSKSLEVNCIDSSSRKLNALNPLLSFKNPYIDYCSMDASDREDIDLKASLSSSDATSKDYSREVYENSANMPFHSSKANYFVQKSENDDAQSCYMLSTFRRNASAAKCQSKKKVLVRECNGIVFRKQNNSPNQSPTKNFSELCVFENRAPKIIDEKFILLLLENLSLLSRTVPCLHKDINSLYLKLRKKHEKLLKPSINQGLGLLGQIYKDEAKAPTDNIETQFDKNEFSDTNTLFNKNIIDAAVNTSIGNLPMNYLYRDKCLSAYVICKEIRDIDCQTDLIDVSKNLFTSKKGWKNNWHPLSPIKDVIIKPKGSNRETMATKCDPISILITDSPKLYQKNNDYINHLSIIAQTSMLSVPSIEHVYTEDKGSNPNWYEHMHSKGTIIKSSFDGNDKLMISPKTIEKEKENNQTDNNQIKWEFDKNADNERRPSLRTRQDLLKEIRLTSPSFKVSTESQTDRRLFRSLRENFKVYPLFVSNIHTTKSNTTTDSNVVFEKSDDLKTLYRCSSDPSYCSGLVSPTAPPLRGPQAGFVSGTPGGRLASWIIESGGPLENASRELGQAQLSVQQLQRLLETLELQHQVHHDTDVSLEGACPNVKKDRRKFGLRKKKSNSKCASIELAPPLHIDQSGSYMALSALTAPPSPGGGASSVPNSASSLPIACAATRPQSLPGAEALGTAAGPASLTSLTPDQQLREDFTVLAKDLLATLKGVVSTLVCERGRLRAAMDSAEASAPPGGAVVSALRTNLSSALQQNSELRSRLSRIHDASDLAEISSVNITDPVTRQFQPSLSYSSSCVSASEFFDAEEHDEDRKTADLLPGDEAGVIELDGDSSSEAGSLSSEEGSASSDNSDGAMLSAEPISLRLNQNGIERRPQTGWSRRACLPCPRPTPGGPSLWNLLYKNIGKDLSQISMPVTINEPLNMLQRLCEELEYSELLEAAASSTNAVERMALVAAFAVSAYSASAHRAASKPFNPLLHETYECEREERGMRFLAEQVSHHPPISACHAEAPRWCFWQEARIKTKFWGKSMEFQPTGRVHVRLASTGDHYSWNKVTTCVHNLFGGQRWVDQYGDMHITCHGTDITCKLSFIKASSWSSSRHEVRGAVTASNSGTRLRLQGRWSEALYAGEPPSARCLWRPGAMPPDHELYYGFTRFAMELNEMEPGQREMLPHTDTRLRPDQRSLELGDVEAAEQHKHELEQSQRERRRDAPDTPPAWFRKTMEGGDETWVFTGEYWKAREAGFSDTIAPRIW